MSINEMAGWIGVGSLLITLGNQFIGLINKGFALYTKITAKKTKRKTKKKPP